MKVNKLNNHSNINNKIYSWYIDKYIPETIISYVWRLIEVKPTLVCIW